MRFDGANYDRESDHLRLMKQHDKIRHIMLDGEWRTLREIANMTGYPESSISAQLRHLRKERFGSYIVSKRRRGDAKMGLFEYHVGEGR